MKQYEAGTPRVSIVIPFLDTPEAIFHEAVESVLTQTLTDWELLLVNDGSGPAASRYALDLAERYGPRVRCLAHPGNVNRGIPAARNLGLQESRAEFIAFLDSDDVWLPSKLEEQVEILESTPDVAMVFGRSVFWRNWHASPSHLDGDYVPPLRVEDRTVLEPPSFLHKFIRMQVLVPCPSSILVRATAARTVGGFEDCVSNLYEDQAFYAKVGLEFSVLACSTIWDRYRLHEFSVVGAALPREQISARREYLDWLLGHLELRGYDDPGFKRTLLLDRLSLDLPMGPRVMRSLRRLANMPAHLSRAFAGHMTAG